MARPLETNDHANFPMAENAENTFTFVMYVEIVHVQCYRGWYVETGYTNTIFGKL